MVGRDFSFLEYGEDVYSPASSSPVAKLLPGMALSDGLSRRVCWQHWMLQLEGSDNVKYVMLQSCGMLSSWKGSEHVFQWKYVLSSLPY